jgi:CheY-like chemotaxis protein
MLLQLLGHQVEEARDGEAAVRKAQEWQLQAALVDIGVPGSDGYVVARRLRAFDSRIQLIALTAHGQPLDCQAALEVGFVHHLPKPVDAQELRRLLETPSGLTTHPAALVRPAAGGTALPA